MTKDPALVILSDSKFVCDSLHLADLLWGGRHDNALRAIRNMQAVATTDGSLLTIEERTVSDERGKPRVVLYFTRKDLSILCAYSEKLRPYFLQYIDRVDSRMAEEIAQLKAENQKSLPKAKVPKKDKRIKVYDEETKSLINVLAQSLDIVELAQGIVDKTRVELAGKKAAYAKKIIWNEAVGDFCKEEIYAPLPLPEKFGFRTEYDEILREKLAEAQELHELADY